MVVTLTTVADFFEVIEAVRSEWPDELPPFLRISATDWLRGAGVFRLHPSRKDPQGERAGGLDRLLLRRHVSGSAGPHSPRLPSAAGEIGKGRSRDNDRRGWFNLYPGACRASLPTLTPT